MGQLSKSQSKKSSHKQIIFSIFVLILVMFGSLFCGRYSISFQEVWSTLLSILGFSDAHISKEAYSIVVHFRLPRIIASAFVGASLAISGAAFQGIFHNPLVSSSLLGVSAGSGFGASLAILLALGSFSTYGLAFVFGLVAVFLSYWIARIYKTVPTIMLVLGGTVVSAIFNALISLLKYAADPAQQLPNIVYWLMGSLASVGYKNFWALIPMALGIIIILAFRWKINVLSMGDKEAQTMGVNVKQTKSLIIIGASLATAGAVCISGIIGWVGLVIPHIGRMIAGNDNRKLLPLTMIIGAAFMVVIDTLSRIILQSEIPLGILTSLVGAPFFIFLLKKTKGGGWQI